MISPAIDAAALAARLDRLPTRLRDALARGFDRLIRSRTAGVPPALSVSIDTTADTVTATIRTAGVPPASTLTLPRKRGREDRRAAASGWGLGPRSPSASSALADMTREIRADLESAARQAFAE